VNEESEEQVAFGERGAGTDAMSVGSPWFVGYACIRQSGKAERDFAARFRQLLL